MPRTDNEWGDWDESQYDVPPRPKWLEDRLFRDENELIDNAATAPVETLQEAPLLSPKEAYLPSLRDFRCWYIWARETRRHERYLQKIEELAVDFKLKTPYYEVDINLVNPKISLGEADLHNMRNDQRNYQELLEQFLRDAKTILEKRGESKIYDGQNILQYQSKNGEYVLSYYPLLDQVVVEKNNCLLAYQKVGQAGVGEKFVSQRDFLLFRRAATY